MERPSLNFEVALRDGAPGMMLYDSFAPQITICIQLMIESLRAARNTSRNVPEIVTRRLHAPQPDARDRSITIEDDH